MRLILSVLALLAIGVLAHLDNSAPATATAAVVASRSAPAK